MSGRYARSAVVDPRTLKPGDQVAVSDAGIRLQVMVAGGLGEHGVDEIWLTLRNEPALTTHLWDDPAQPVPRGNVALDLDGQGWTVGVLPQVLARRAIR